MTALDGLTACEVIDALDLEFLDGEGVWIKLLWRSDHGSAIYGFLTPEDFSALHVLREDELWVHVAGAPVDMLLLHPGGRQERRVLGTDIGSGQTPTVLVPAATWQGSRTMGEWSLVVCSLAPPFSGFALADSSTDFTAWPDAADAIGGLIRG